MGAYQPAVHKAHQWLVDRISDGRIRSGDRLPPIRTMAATCGVSTVSMHRALSLLRTEGLIAGNRGHRPVVTGRDGLPSGDTSNGAGGDASLRSGVVERIAGEMHRSIVLGGIGSAGPIPSLKELQQRFRASHRTIRSAMRRLQTEGLLDVNGRWYRVSEYRPPRATARILMVGFLYRPNAALIRGHHDDLVCGLLQTECRRRNLAFDQVGLPLGPGVDFYELESGRLFTFTGDILGCVVLLNQISANWPHLFRTVSGLRVPVAVIDEFGDWNVSGAFPSPGRVRVFSFSSGAAAAREIVRTLTRYGHRSFSFISPHQGSPWSRVRSAAVREELAAAGLAHNFHPVEFDISEDSRELRDGLLAEKVHQDTQRFLLSYPQVVQDAYARAFSVPAWNGRMIDAAVEQSLRAFIEPLLQRDDITAWIAVNDRTAMTARSILQEKGVTVPSRLSLASFDNSPGAQDAHLASYDFNVPGLVSCVLDFLTGSYDARALRPASRVDVPGTFVERSSVGPAPVTAYTPV